MQKIDLANRARTFFQQGGSHIPKPVQTLKQSIATLPMEVQDIKGGPKFPASQVPDAKTVDALFAEWASQQTTQPNPSDATSKAYDRELTFDPSQDLFSQPPRKRQKTQEDDDDSMLDQ